LPLVEGFTLFIAPFKLGVLDGSEGLRCHV